MKVSIVIATYGSDDWAEAAWSHAYGSTIGQGQFEMVVHHEPDGTLASARNNAAAQAHGDWLCFLDADDRLGDGYLDAIRAADFDEFDATPVGDSYGYRLFVPSVQYVENGRCVGDPEIPSWGRPLIDINCAVIGTLVSRHLFEEVGGFRELPIYEDFDLWIRCVARGAKMVAVPDATYCATRRVGGRNTSGSPYETYDQIRSEFADTIDWASVSSYKIG